MRVHTWPHKVHVHMHVVGHAPPVAKWSSGVMRTSAMAGNSASIAESKYVGKPYPVSGVALSHSLNANMSHRRIREERQRALVEAAHLVIS